MHPARASPTRCRLLLGRRVLTVATLEVVVAGHHDELAGLGVVGAVGGGHYPPLVDHCGATDVVRVPIHGELQRHLPRELVCGNME